jgi:hypothetical protein
MSKEGLVVAIVLFVWSVHRGRLKRREDGSSSNVDDRMNGRPE